MGRRKLPDDEKRQLHSLRLDPQDRIKIEAIASSEGQSFAAIAERHLKAGLEIMAHPMMTPELKQIFVSIMDEMAEVHALTPGKHWWKSLRTWAACKMIFAKGPFARRNPDDWKADPIIDELWQTVSQTRLLKQNAAALLDTMGVKVNPEKVTTRQGRSGIFGRMNALLAGTYNNRLPERAAILAIKNDAIKAQAQAVFEIVETLDAQEEEQLEKWYAEVKQYTDVEKDGEQLYRTWRRDKAQQAMANGELPDFEDLF